MTWRDIQHLCVRTARILNPDDPDWEPTAAGRPYSYKFGFGVLDASRYIEAARDWELVKPQAWFQTETIQLNGGEMDTQYDMSGGVFIAPGGVTSTISITKDMLEANNFEALEHINVRVWIAHAKRGDVEVEIVSPNGITSMLAAKRNADTDITGYPGWTFMSVKHWYVIRDFLSIVSKHFDYDVIIFFQGREPYRRLDDTRLRPSEWCS